MGIIKTDNIEKFVIKNANYFLSDDKFRILLKLNYWGNSYETKILKGKINKEVEKEINKIATDMLKRKSKKNFAVRDKSKIAVK